MIFIGDDVEICFEKGGECAIKYQDLLIGGIQEIELSLKSEKDKRVCKMIRLTDKVAYARQLAFGAEMVKAGFSVIWVLSEPITVQTSYSRIKPTSSQDWMFNMMRTGNNPNWT